MTGACSPPADSFTGGGSGGFPQPALVAITRSNAQARSSRSHVEIGIVRFVPAGMKETARRCRRGAYFSSGLSPPAGVAAAGAPKMSLKLVYTEQNSTGSRMISPRPNGIAAMTHSTMMMSP
jgi:hypothetical protein